jgi:hypothetical protein
MNEKINLNSVLTEVNKEEPIQGVNLRSERYNNAYIKYSKDKINRKESLKISINSKRRSRLAEIRNKFDEYEEDILSMYLLDINDEDDEDIRTLFISCPNCIKGLLIQTTDTILCTHKCIELDTKLLVLEDLTFNNFAEIFMKKVHDHRSKVCKLANWEVLSNPLNIICINCIYECFEADK